MSYIQIELKGKKRGLKFNQLAIEIFSKHLDDTSNASMIYACIYAGLRGNSYVKREDVDYTFEDVCDWVDEASEEALTAASDCMASTDAWKKALSKIEDSIRLMQPNNDKKKMRKRRMNTGS